MGPEIVAPVAFFATIAIVFVSRSHIGRAIADRIRGGGGRSPEVELEIEGLRAEVDALRGELGDVNERLDFAERLLPRAAEKSRHAEPL